MVALRTPPRPSHSHSQSPPSYDPNLWYIFGLAYDLTPFLSHHPGGLKPLLISRGTDCTNLLRSYHFLPTPHLLRRLRPYQLTTHPPHDPFNDYPHGPLPDSPFHHSLKRLLLRYRRKTPLTIRTPHLCLVLLSLALLVSMLLAHLYHPRLSLALALPLIAWLPTCLVSHDGSHFATHHHPLLNSLSALLCSPFYFNSTVWLLQHVISHHQYTNDPRRDVDMHHGSWLARMSRAQPWYPWMPRTVIPFLLLLQLVWSTVWESVILPVALLLDLVCGTQRTFPSLPNKNNLVRRYWPAMLLQLLLTLTVMLAPFLTHARPIPFHHAYVYGILPYHISSVVFILATQFAHLTDRSAVRMARLNGGRDSFAEAQVAASVDVRPASHWLNVLTGGLNTQSLHHLVPGVHNSHFPALYPEYRRICKQHGVELCEAESVVGEFVRYLRDVIGINQRRGDEAGGMNAMRQEGGEVTFSVEEVAGRDDVLVIDGGVYGIGEFERRHPGGRVISTLSGLDATNIFYSTHRGSVGGVEKVLGSLRMGRVRERGGRGGIPESTVSAVPRADEFLVELNREVSCVLREGEGLRGEGLRAGWVRTWTLVGWMVGYCVVFGMGGVGMFVRGVVAGWMGVCACALVGQVAHEETHGVLRWWGASGEGGKSGRHGWLRRWVVSTVWGVLWPSMSEPYFRFEHTTHHVEPLNPEFDYEVSGLSYFVRYKEGQRWRVWHRWQHVYAWALYGFYIWMQTVFEYPLGFFRRFHKRYERGVWHWYNWSVTAAVYVVLPMWLGVVNAWQQATLVLVYTYVWQLLLYLVAAINHAVDVKAPPREELKHIWSYHVLQHTSNFCVQVPFWNWLSGGFNIQNEHHLLSWIPQEHLYRAVPVTKRLCAKYGYPYHEFPSFGALLQSHYRALHKFGQRP